MHLSGSDLVLLESNYDESMLKNGPYPYELKRRIASDHGHLSNSACGEQLKKLMTAGTYKFILVRKTTRLCRLKTRLWEHLVITSATATIFYI